MTDEKRAALNAERLLLVDETIRRQVGNVLATLEFYGFRPLIAKEVWRDPAVQLAMYKRGVSKLKWGFHCFTRGGRPASLAADIIDAQKAWNASREFWVILGYAAKAQHLGWGAYWGLTPALKTGLEQAFEVVKSGGKVPGSVKLGWDPAHVQVAGITVAQARARAT